MPNRRGAISSTPLLLLAGVALTGVGYLVGNHYRPKVVEPPVVAQIDTIIVADSLALKAREARWQAQRDGMVRDFNALQQASLDSIRQAQALAGQHFQSSVDGAQGANELVGLADSLRATVSDVRIRFGADTALSVTLHAYSVLHSGADSLNRAYLGMRDSYLDQQRVSIQWALRGSQAEGELNLERWFDSVRVDSLHQAVDSARALGRRQEAAFRDKLKTLAPWPTWTIGLGASATMVPGPTLCGASVAGVQVQAQTRGWLKLSGQLTAGYGAAGCASGKVQAGPAGQIGGSISL